MPVLLPSVKTKLNSGFSPASVPGCALWLDAADRSSLTLSGSNVTQWNDKSGSGTTITGITGTPVWTSNGLNGRPTINVTSGNFRGTLSSSLPASNFTHSTFIVTRLSSAPGRGSPLFVLTQTETAYSFWYRTLDYTTQNGTGLPLFRTVSFATTLATTTEIAAQTTSPFIWSEQYDGSQSNSSIVSLSNGGSQSTTVLSGAPTTTPGFFTIGIEWNPTDGFERYTWPGTVSEIILYNIALTVSQRQQLEGYLAAKWGLQANLPAVHPHRSLPPFLRSLTPVDIPGCALWLDAADPNGTGVRPASGSTLTTWKDKSPSDFPVTSVGSAYSTTAVNGMPGINIGTNFFGFNPGSAQNNWQEVFAVGVWTGGSTFNSFNGFVTSSVNSDGGEEGGIILIGNVNTRNWYSSSSHSVPFLNGVQTSLFLPAGSTPFIVRTNSISSVNLRGIRFGVDRSNGRNWIGFISEVICYNSSLTVSQRQQLEAYLAEKWGLRGLMPVAHPGRTRISQVPVFIPISLPGCALWLDAADRTALTLSGSSVTQWSDKSGNNRHGTPGASPVLSEGGVLFSGAQHLFVANASGLFVNTAFHIFCVEKLNSGGAGYFLSDDVINGGGATNASLHIGYRSISNLGFAFWANDLETTGLSGNPTRLWSFNLPQTANRNTRLNGSLNATLGNSTKLTTMTTLTLGRRFGGPNAVDNYTGRIYEMIAYTGELSASAIQQVEGYLAHKWKLQANLPTSHPYRGVSV